MNGKEFREYAFGHLRRFRRKVRGPTLKERVGGGLELIQKGDDSGYAVLLDIGHEIRDRIPLKSDPDKTGRLEPIGNFSSHVEPLCMIANGVSRKDAYLHDARELTLLAAACAPPGTIEHEIMATGTWKSLNHRLDPTAWASFMKDTVHALPHGSSIRERAAEHLMEITEDCWSRPAAPDASMFEFQEAPRTYIM